MINKYMQQLVSYGGYALPRYIVIKDLTAKGCPPERQGGYLDNTDVTHAIPVNLYALKVFKDQKYWCAVQLKMAGVLDSINKLVDCGVVSVSDNGIYSTKVSLTVDKV